MRVSLNVGLKAVGDTKMRYGLVLCPFPRNGEKAYCVVGWLPPGACGETKANDDLICAVFKGSVNAMNIEY
jgi:hypothetical protein